MSELNLSLTDLQRVAIGLEMEYDGMSEEQLKEAITSDIKVYSKIGCVYCENAKNLLKSKRIPFRTINVTPEMKQRVMQEIRKTTGKTPPGTFPAIVQGNRFIGGYDELNAAFGEKNSCVIL